MTEGWKDRLDRETREAERIRKNPLYEVELKAYLVDTQVLLRKHAKELGIPQLVEEMRSNWGKGEIFSPEIVNNLQYTGDAWMPFKKTSLRGEIRLVYGLKFEAGVSMESHAPAQNGRMDYVYHSTRDGGMHLSRSKEWVPAQAAKTSHEYIHKVAAFSSGVVYRVTERTYGQPPSEDVLAFVHDSESTKNELPLYNGSGQKVYDPNDPYAKKTLNDFGYEAFKHRSINKLLPSDLQRNVDAQVEHLSSIGWKKSR